MNHDTEGVYSRMYRAMADHKQGLISFDEMMYAWKAEAKIIKEQHSKDVEEKSKIGRGEAA